MDKNEHLPGDSLADFTEDELFSLIDVGSSGAFSEFYRRHIASATVLAAADSANPRSRADAAFLAILKTLLDGTADRSSGFTALIRDEIVRSSDSDSAASSSELTEAEPEDLSSFAVIASAFSSLPDNWQRILWLREVEGQSAQSAAELLDITSATADRLTARAREELESTWTQTRPADGPLSIADRAELIPALLTSPILIERLSDTFVAAPGPDLDAEVAAAESVDTGELPAAAESTDPAESVDTDELVAAAESSDAAADSSVSPPVVPISETPKETGESSAETIDEPADHDEVPKFTLPKPVLVPLIAVCLGLLCTLLGFAILPSGDSGPGPRTNSTAGSGSASEPKSTTDDSDETRASDGSGGSTSADPAHGADNDAPSSRDEDRDTDSDTSPRPGDKASELPADSPGSSGTDAPSKSSDSDDPTAPDEPSAPDEPESPDSPSQPESPDEPETPSEPDPTEDPGTPSEPESPEEPETPSEPESPSDPGAPSEPESPSTP